jgi:hypothetical protein
MKTHTTRISVEIPVDPTQRSPLKIAVARVATMLEHGNRTVGEPWIVVTDYSTGTISLIPKPGGAE